MEIGLLSQYIIVFYGVSVPLFYATYKLTYSIMIANKSKRTQIQDYNYNSPQVQTSRVKIPEVDKYNRIKEISENDNISTHDRITLIKNEMKKKK